MSIKGDLPPVVPTPSSTELSVSTSVTKVSFPLITKDSTTHSVKKGFFSRVTSLIEGLSGPKMAPKLQFAPTEKSDSEKFSDKSNLASTSIHNQLVRSKNIDLSHNPKLEAALSGMQKERQLVLSKYDELSKSVDALAIKYMTSPLGEQIDDVQAALLGMKDKHNILLNNLQKAVTSDDPKQVAEALENVTNSMKAISKTLAVASLTINNLEDPSSGIDKDDHLRLMKAIPFLLQSLDKGVLGQVSTPDFHKFITSQEGSKGSSPTPTKEWEVEKEANEKRSLEEMQRSHPTKFTKDFTRNTKIINGETIGKDEKEMAKAGAILFDCLRKELPSPAFDDKDAHTLRFEIEYLTNQLMNGIDIEGFQKYTMAAFAQEKSMPEMGPEDLKGTGKSNLRYEINIKDKKVVITSVEYSKLVPMSGENKGKITGYDAHRVTIEIDLNKITKDQLLATPGCATVRDTWHGARPKFEDIAW